MDLLERILHTFGFVRASQPVVPVDADLLLTLEELAAAEASSVPEMAQELLQHAVAERHTAVANLQLWASLTPREKQTAVLACAGLTNREIAQRMVISPNTVKTHVRNILRKFDVGSKAGLREALAGWDFSNWLADQGLGSEPTGSPPPALPTESK